MKFSNFQFCVSDRANSSKISCQKSSYIKHERTYAVIIFSALLYFFKVLIKTAALIKISKLHMYIYQTCVHIMVKYKLFTFNVTELDYPQEYYK